MSDPNDFLKQRLYHLRQTARSLLHKAGRYGSESELPLNDQHSLRETREGIAECKAELRARGVAVDDRPEDAAPPAHGPLPGRGVSHLRAPVADFVGRAAELAQVVAALQPDQAGRAAAISGVRGMGGLGKTELAYAAAAQLAGGYPDGQVLLELGGASATPLSPAQALQQVIRAFRPEDRLPEEVEALKQLYRTTLAGRRVLILADDARDATQVRLLLPPVGSALLVTSRQRFVLDGMRLVDLGRLDEAPAVALLRGICTRLTEEQAQQIARLCGYLPLALRASAGILLNDTALTPERYIELLVQQPLAALRDPDDPARDVGAILLLSYAALDPPEQQVFRRLGVLGADADLALIAELLELPEDQASDLLRKLLRRSLVEYDEVRERWGMHDLVRACGLGLLVEAGEEQAAQLHYARLVIALIDRADRHYRQVGVGMVEGLALFDRERNHLEVVRAWLWSQPPVADIDALLISEADATSYIGDLRDPLRAVRAPQLERVLAAARRQGDRRAEGAFLGNLGNTYADLGEVRRALTFHEQALAIVREVGERRGEGIVLGNLGSAYADLGEVRRSITFYEQALAIAREVGNRRGEGIALGNLGFAWAMLEDHAQAHHFYWEQLRIHQEIGYKYGEALALDNLGTTFLSLGDAVQARSHCEAALVLARDLGDRRLEGTALRGLANALAALGMPTEADACYVQSLAIHDELDYQSEATRTRWAYGHFLLGQGQRERGLALMAVRVAYEQRIGHAQAEEHAAELERLRAQGTA